MEIITIITMVLVLGIVWGGLAFFLLRSIKYEKVKIKMGKRKRTSILGIIPAINKRNLQAVY